MHTNLFLIVFITLLFGGIQSNGRQTGWRVDRQTDRQAGGLTDRQTGWRVDRQTDRQTGGRVDRQTGSRRVRRDGADR